MFIVTDAELQYLIAAIDRILNSQEFIEKSKDVELNTKGLTHHGFETHAIPVFNLGTSIMDGINGFYPETFSAFEILFAAKLALLAHDIGRSSGGGVIDGQRTKDRHEIDGAVFVNQLLLRENIPARLRGVVSYAIVNHRTSRLKKRNALAMPRRPMSEEERAYQELLRRVLAVVILADKCVGDAQRVRATRQLFLKSLRMMRISNRYFERANEDLRNDFANFAVKRAAVTVDPTEVGRGNGTRGWLVLSLDLDERVCTMQQILEVEWFREAYDCCRIAAATLGFDFRIQTTSVNRMTDDNREATWYWSEEHNDWRRRTAIEVERE